MDSMCAAWSRAGSRLAECATVGRFRGVEFLFGIYVRYDLG